MLSFAEGKKLTQVYLLCETAVKLANQISIKKQRPPKTSLLYNYE
jgi:hypothetical protein